MVLAVIALAVTSQTGIPLPGGGDDGDRLPASTVGPSPAAVAQVPPTATAAPTATIEAPAPGTDVIEVAAQTAEAIGVGGESTTEPEESMLAPTSAPPALAGTVGGATATVAAGDDLAAAGADEPTEVPTTASTATQPPAPTPTPEGTDPPTAEPTATEEPAPTATEEAASTATEQPAIVPAVETDAAGLPVATETAASQAPSLATGEIPNQTFVSGPFRFSIVGAVRSPSVPALGLYDYGTGEWVALFVDIVNWSTVPATLNLPEFVLSDGSREAPIALDTGTALIARTAGLETAYVHDALVPYAPGEQHRILLLYLVTPEAFDLTLRTNEAAVALDGFLAETFDPADLPAEEPLAPELVQGFVTAVIDGQTIEVNINGELRQVRYLGIDVPINTDCWAVESTQANINLTIGQLVWLERQRSNADGQDRLLRDVWVIGWDGYFDLVAERLVAQGAAEPATTEPNTRLAGWLEGSATDAAAVGYGRWGFCPVSDSEIGIEPVLAILLPFAIGMVWVVLGTPGLASLTQSPALKRRADRTKSLRD
jgi:endonuclease YncB( thermonuclease family)